MEEIAGQQAISLTAQESFPGGSAFRGSGLHLLAHAIRRTVASLI